MAILTLNKIKEYIPVGLLAAILFALLVHVGGLAFVLSNSGQEVLIWGDGVRYMELANNLNDGLGFVYFNEDIGANTPELFRTPGVPFLLSLFMNDGVLSNGYFYIITILSAIVVTCAIFYVGATLFSRSVGIIAAWLYVLEPLTTISSWHVHVETPLLIVGTTGLAVLVSAYTKHNAYHALIGGLLLGLSIYIRPAMFVIYILAFGLLFLFGLAKNRKYLSTTIIAGLVVIIMLVPWLQHVKQESGVYAITASGWWNVYTNYIGSIRWVEDGGSFTDKTIELKTYAIEELGIGQLELSTPSASDTLRRYALQEIREHPKTVVKLESSLLFSYFTHTGYHARLSKMNVVDKLQYTLSPTQTLLSNGVAGIKDVFIEMKRMYFIPIFERVWSIGLLLFAIIGVLYKRKNYAMLLFLLLVGFSALSATADGLGVEGRYRIPALPLYFIIASVGIHVTFVWAKKTLKMKRHGT